MTPRFALADTKAQEESEEWILVEEEASGSGLVPDGADYIPGARILVARRVGAIPKNDEIVVKIELVRAPASLGVGDQVEALVYVENGEAGTKYEILIEPTRHCVRVTPSTAFVVFGREKVRVRFTSLADGQAGIRVTCRPATKREVGKKD